MNTQRLDWNEFKVKNQDYHKVFEELTYHLFCRKYDCVDGIHSYKNQAGIETDPIQHNGDYIGFQTKWFDNTINYKSLELAIEKAKKKNPNLTKIIFYIYPSFSESSKTNEKKSNGLIGVEKSATDAGISLEWVVESQLNIIICKNENRDLQSKYFKSSDGIGFIKQCINPYYQTLLNSKSYLELPLYGMLEKKPIEINNILQKEDKICLISGYPGSGKSVLMYKLFSHLANLDINDSDGIRVDPIEYIPIIINLKDCSLNDLESLIRDRKKEYNINNEENFIYLFDGLDELNIESSEHALSYILKLRDNGTTKKIIISCRTGNFNITRAKIFFENIPEYKIRDLTQDQIIEYFKNKKDDRKLTLLKQAINDNLSLLLEIKEILLLNIFWESIERLNQNETVIDLFDLKFQHLIDGPLYAKNFQALNLLEPKKDHIININKKLSIEFQKRFQFRFLLVDIQKIIMDNYPKLDYKEINLLVEYLANCYFDFDSKYEYFIYKHRRYQEYFFLKHLTDEYEKSLSVLRKNHVLSNKDLFENIFLKYLRKNYTNDVNIPGIVELNLIDVYLGHHSYFGADDPDYKNSKSFIISLAKQNNIAFQELLFDENLSIREKIIPDFKKIEDRFSFWLEHKEDDQVKEELSVLWEHGVSSLINNIAIFYKFGKVQFANELKDIYQNIITLFTNNKFIENIEENHERINDPRWESWESYLYFLVNVKQESPNDIFVKKIKPNYHQMSDNIHLIKYEESGKEKLIKSFLRVCLDIYDISILCSLITDLDECQFLMLLEVLASNKHVSSFKYLKLLFQDNDFTSQLQKRVENTNKNNVTLLFCKVIYKCNLTDSQKQYLNEELKKIEHERHYELDNYGLHVEYALISYILKVNSFDKILHSQELKSSYSNQKVLYASLFTGMMDILKENATATSIIRSYIEFVEICRYLECTQRMINRISRILGQIFIFSDMNTQQLLYIKEKLFNHCNRLNLFEFYSTLNEFNEQVFIKLVNESELDNFKELEISSNGLLSEVNRYFDLSILHNSYNSKKSINYIRTGINHSILRHGWRKDHIVSYSLVEALEIMWENNFLSQNDLVTYSKQIFNLAFRVTQITDGKHTWQGPYNVIDLLSRYDLNLAIELKEELKKLEQKDGSKLHNYAISYILKGMIARGYKIQDINTTIDEYAIVFNSDGSISSDYYEAKFLSYIEIIKNDFYTENEKLEAFNESYKQIIGISNSKLNYFLTNKDEIDSKQIFISLCNKYSKDCMVHIDSTSEDDKNHSKISEQEFLIKVKEAKTDTDIITLYTMLQNDENGITLTTFDSWKALIDKTYSIFKNIKEFTCFLHENRFPETDWHFTHNSKYLYFGLGYALSNQETKSEALEYLLKTHTGHAGFINIIKSYASINDKKMVISLFKRYLRVCEFIVY